MPFDPAKPAFGSPDSSAEMRDQLNALDDFILSLNSAKADTAAVNAALASAVAGTSSNSNAVGMLGQAASGGYDQGQMQAVLDKLDELIAALRR